MNLFRITLFIVVFTFITTQQLRFADSQIMKKHHNHTNPSNQQINVFLIPHSHDDVGWLKTVDNYYYGGDQGTQWAGVQYTIDTVVSQLASNPTYKFSIVEVAFLYRWWNNANSTQRNNMIQAVKNGQLQFINAGWCMSDEATPYYQDMIDQMTIGLKWIKDTFNYVPSIGWHIDPFGHQSSNAAMFSQMGFNAWFFARIDYQDKSLRMSNKGLQMIWHPNQYSNIDNYIFTHVNYYHYSPPPGFCFDLKCNDEPIKDDPTLQDYNVDTRSKVLVDYFKSMALHYRSNNLLHTLGEDFHYANARMWYKNYDKLIKYINQRPEFGVKLSYSTPSQYVKAVNQQGNTYPTKYDDFFPYADRQHGYWTGYFVSRVSLKGFVRQLGRYLQAARTHLSLLKLEGNSDIIKQNPDKMENAIWQLETAIGILQHHDAVAGTAKQKVTNDYILIGSRGLSKFNEFYNSVLKQQVNKQIGQNISQVFTGVWNNTADEWGINKVLANNKSVLINLYNPGQKMTRTIKLKVSSINMDIIDSKNNKIEGNLICSNLSDASDCQLFFNLPFEQTSYNFIKLIPLSTQGSVQIIKHKDVTIAESTVIWKLTQTVSLKLTRALQSFEFTLPDQIFPFTIGYNYYESYQGSGQKSGAYIFRASVDTLQTPKAYTKILGFSYAQGSVVTVILIKGDKTTTRFYLSKTPGYIQNYGFQIQTYVNSIDVSDNIGKQVVLTVSTQYTNGGRFTTDSNGLEKNVRIIDYRPTWPLINDEPAAGNYYPVNSQISIYDTKSGNKFSILPDRSQGGSSIKDGSIEIMIHRRCLFDDGRGVGQALNQKDADGQGLRQLFRHYIVFGDANRVVQKWNDQRVLVTWANTNTNTFAKYDGITTKFIVPPDMKLYLRAYTDDSYLLRLHNFNTNSTSIVTIPDGWKATQLTLGGNQLLSDWSNKKYKWNEQPYIFENRTKVQNNYHINRHGQKMSLKYELEQGEINFKKFEMKTFKLSKV